MENNKNEVKMMKEYFESGIVKSEIPYREEIEEFNLLKNFNKE